jgi:hypothetical protein
MKTTATGVEMRNNNHQRKEHRCTEREECSRHCSRSSSSCSSSSQECNIIHENQEKEKKTKVPSSEILIAMPTKKDLKKYTIYLGLIDLGASGLLVHRELMELADFGIKLQKKPTNGILLPEFFRQTVHSSLRIIAYLSSRENRTLPLPSTCTRKRQKTNMILS